MVIQQFDPLCDYVVAFANYLTNDFFLYESIQPSFEAQEGPYKIFSYGVD